LKIGEGLKAETVSKCEALASEVVWLTAEC